MPLSSWYALHFHGPGLMAAVAPAPSLTAAARLTGLGGLSAFDAAVPTAYARALRGQPATAFDATLPTAYARILGRARLAAVGRVNELTQDDVTGAVLEAQIEPGVSLKEAIRLLTAVAAGKTTIDVSGPNPVVTFRDLSDTKDRVEATMIGSERSIVNTDLS